MAKLAWLTSALNHVVGQAAFFWERRLVKPLVRKHMLLPLRDVESPPHAPDLREPLQSYLE
jgi:hypothetical protein